MLNTLNNILNNMLIMLNGCSDCSDCSACSCSSSWSAKSWLRIVNGGRANDGDGWDTRYVDSVCKS